MLRLRGLASPCNRPRIVKRRQKTSEVLHAQWPRYRRSRAQDDAPACGTMAPLPKPESSMKPPLLLSCALLLPVSGCAVITVAGAAAGAAISVTGSVVSTGVKVTGKVIEAAIPDGDDDKEKKDE